MRDLQEALAIEGLVGDPRFATLDGAVDNREALRERLAPIFAEKTNDEWIPLLEAKDILVAPVRSTAEALADPQLEVNEMLVEVQHPQVGAMRHVGTPLRLAGTPAPAPTPAPLAGEHTEAVLREAGYADDEIAALRHTGRHSLNWTGDPMPDIVRYGLLSTAQIALNRHLPAAQAIGNAEVAAISSRDQAKAEASAAQYGIAKAYGSYQAVLGRSRNRRDHQSLAQ